MYEKMICYHTDIDGLIDVNLGGISYCDGTYKIRRRNSEVNVFEYIIKGRGSVTSDGRSFEAAAGDVYILKKGSNHFYYSSKDDPWIKIWFNIAGPMVDSLLSLYHIEDVVYKDCSALKLFEEFLNLVKSYPSSYKTSLFCTEKLLEIVSFISSYKRKVILNDGDIIKKYIDDNIKLDITLNDMAKAVCKSPSQTIRLFKRCFGKTPYSYLIEQRINASKLLLRNTNMTVKQIACELNFADEHYFSNVFKKVTSIAPSTYKQQLLKK